MDDKRMIDDLEQRVLMAAAPKVVDVFADNRGTAWIRVDQPLNAKTVTRQSAQILVNGRARRVAVSYDAAQKQVRIATTKDLAKNTPYTIHLKSALLKGADGKKLNGEFNGNNKASGNAKAGGDFVARTLVSKKTKVARMETVYGNLDLNLFHKQTPITVKNFMAYADAGDWDGIFFHQLGPTAPNSFLFGGVFYPSEDDQLQTVASRGTISNEPKPGKPGNVFGTIAMNRNVDGNPQTTEDQNSATHEWIFNLQDNRQDLDQHDGGYTVFGKVLNKRSAAVLRKIGRTETIDAGLNLDFLPVKDLQKIFDNDGVFDPQEDLITIHRVSMEMALAAPAAARRAATELRSDVTMMPSKTPSMQAGVLDDTDDLLA